MPDKSFLDELKAKMAEAGEEVIDPAVEGLVHMGDALDKQARGEKAARESLEKRLDEKQQEVRKELEQAKASMDAGFTSVVDKLENLEKRQMAGGRLSFATDPASKMLDAIPESNRSLIGTYSADRTRIEKSGKPAEFHALCDLWFATAAKCQLKEFGRDFAENRERLDKIETALADVYGKAAYTGGTDATGGYGVPNPVLAEVFRIVKDNGVVVPLTRQIPMGSDTLLVPNEFADFTVRWVAEAGTLTGGENTFAQNTLNATKIIGRATASREAVDDINFGLMGYVREIISEFIARELDQEIMEGDGTNFTGLNAETSINSVATTTTDGEAVAYADIAKAMFAASESSTRVNSVWIMHPAIFGTVVGLVDSQSQPIFQYANVPDMPPERLLGRPVYTSSALSRDITRGSTGSTSNIYFGDPRRLILGVRQAMRFEVSDAPNWGTDQIDMRMIGRFGFTVNKAAAFTKIVGCIDI